MKREVVKVGGCPVARVPVPLALPVLHPRSRGLAQAVKGRFRCLLSICLGDLLEASDPRWLCCCGRGVALPLGT